MLEMATLRERSNRFFIGGDWVRPSSPATIEVISPSTEEAFVRVAEAQAEDIDRAVAAARAAFDYGPWPRMTHAERAAYILRLAEKIEERAAEVGHIWTSETGVVAGIADHLGMMVGGVYRYYASLAETFPFVERHTPQAGNVGLLVREPVGVVAAVLPWNGPLGLIAYKTAPALLAGCTIVIKSPPEAPASGYVIADIAREIGLPPGVINVVTAERAVSELLVRHPGIDKVTFTGSTAAGKKIASICGERIARCTLELGGKSAAVVLDDYDVEAVAQSISGTARVMTGQVCASLTRVIVSRDRHDAMLDALSAEFAKINVGDPFDPASDMGPLAMSRQRDRVEGFIAKGREEGAVVATGGGRPAHLNRGFYVEPTVFGNVRNDMVIAREEIFGPVVSVIPADNEAQAIEIANDSTFGLNASVFTNDAQRAYHAARQLRSGTVGHNAQRIDFSIAFGGFKQSGIGREGGTEGLLPFLETKTIILDAEPDQL
jgi:acyl-CoA reductase-like NAD-dependent aldehyde dehydrogenase